MKSESDEEDRVEKTAVKIVTVWGQRALRCPHSGAVFAEPSEAKAKQNIEARKKQAAGIERGKVEPKYKPRKKYIPTWSKGW